jgi:C4-dicarboxylate transporter, DctM subunit
MSEDSAVSQDTNSEDQGLLAKVSSVVSGAETGLLTLALALLVSIPLLERLLRHFTDTGISGASVFVQHLSLVIAMLGGAVAAREDRLLAISTLSQVVSEGWKNYIKVISNSIAAAITIYLGIASIELITTEREAESLIAYGIRIWVVQLIIPAGFAAIAIRILWNSGTRWPFRLAACGGTLLLLLLTWKAPIAVASLWLPGIVVIVLATVLGAPIFTTLGGAALLFFWAEELPISIVAVSQYSLVVEAMVPTIPLFTLAGFVLAESKASDRLVGVFQSLVGQYRIGPPLVTVLVCAFFTSFTGGSGVTILALGPLLMPLLLAAQCPERKALGLLSGAGSLGIMFPPALPVILYFIVANSNGDGSLKLEHLFLGGLIPGLMMLGILAFWGARQIPVSTIQSAPFSWKKAGKSIMVAKWELMLPVVALVSLFGGLFSTPVAAAAATALYAILIETVIHRDLSFTRDIPRVFSKCGLLVGGVLLILGMAFGFTNVLIDAQVPDRAIEWVTATIHSKWLFLLSLNILLILVGCLMDIFSAIVVVVPLLIPLGVAFGIDPVHLAILFLVNLELGYLTPPVGMNLFLAAYRFDKPILEVARAAIPVLILFLISALLVTFFPPLTTFLPSLME